MHVPFILQYLARKPTYPLKQLNHDLLFFLALGAHPIRKLLTAFL